MPKGKGTYGSQVGRPSESKENEYFGGGMVTNDARDRMENMVPNVVDTNVSMPMYKEGGKVEVEDDWINDLDDDLKEEYDSLAGKAGLGSGEHASIVHAMSKKLKKKYLASELRKTKKKKEAKVKKSTEKKVDKALEGKKRAGKDKRVRGEGEVTIHDILARNAELNKKKKEELRRVRKSHRELLAKTEN